MKEFRGGCHCGNVTYTLQWPSDDEPPFRKCQCSFCTKHNPTYTAHPRAVLAVTVKDADALTRYQFGTRTADFCLRTHCGVMPIVTSRLDGRAAGVINANTLQDVDVPATVQTRNFDSETIEDRLGRRRQTWIPDVTIIVA